MFLIIPVIFGALSYYIHTVESDLVECKDFTSCQTDEYDKTIDKFYPAKPRGI